MQRWRAEWLCVLASCVLLGAACASSGGQSTFDGSTAQDLASSDLVASDAASPDAATAPCGLVSDKGQCSGDTRQWCSNSALQTQDCGAMNKTCGLDPNGFAGCRYKNGSACGTTVTMKAMCDGNNVIFCDNTGLINVYECSASGKICATVNMVTDCYDHA
jgi:hypothetical protein